MHTLFASLSDHSMTMLRGIAEVRGLEAELPTTAMMPRPSLPPRLAEQEATAAALAACSAGGRAAWQALVAADGKLKTPVFTRHHGAIRPVGPGRLEREAVWQQPQGPAEELWYRGLIFRGFADLGDGPAEYIYIPTGTVAPAPRQPRRNRLRRSSRPRPAPPASNKPSTPSP